MASERRLHPASVVFELASTARALLVPGIAVLLAPRADGWGWQVAAMALFVPFAIGAIVRVFTFGYRLEADELVIRSGVIFRSVRHVPYTRIHNIDAVQNIVHRLFGVAEVRIETGGGAEPEASLRVLSLEVFEDLRRTVLERRQALAAPGSGVTPVDVAADAPPAAAPAADLVLQLSPRELMLAGFIHNRSAILIGAAFGLVWEFGIGEAAIERVFGEQAPGEGMVRQIVLALGGRAEMPLAAIAVAVGVLLGALLLLRVISVVWTLVTLYGYTLVYQADDLRASFGLLTRVTATTPLRRIQTWTIREGWLHRRFGRVAVRVQTAGNTVVDASERPRREALAPILRREDVPAFVRRVLPGLADAADLVWHPPHPRAVRRVFARSAVVFVLLSCPLIYPLRWWWLALVPLLASWAALHARLSVRHLRWALAEDAVYFRSGWYWRQMTIVRLARIQAAAVDESPFDRRHGMATVVADTFGASGATHHVHIPFVPRGAAGALHAVLYDQAARTAFKA